MTAQRSAVPLLVSLAIMLVYIALKAQAVGHYWFDGIDNWQKLFRPFPDWGSGADLYGALLASKWIGTRTLCHAAAFLAVLVLALRFRAYRLAAFFACEAAAIELLDMLWLTIGIETGWATPGTRGAITLSGAFAAGLLASAWMLFRLPSAAPLQAAPAPDRNAPSAGPFGAFGRWFDRWFILLCYLVAVAYALMKILFAYWWCFDGPDFWLAAFRPFPDWGSGGERFGALLPAKWIGTRNFAYGVFILFAVWYSRTRGDHRLIGLLLLQGALIELFDGLWLANGKYNWLWTGLNTDFYMNGGFLWTPDLLVVGIYLFSRSHGSNRSAARPYRSAAESSG